jgi:hypothetical protein
LNATLLTRNVKLGGTSPQNIRFIVETHVENVQIVKTARVAKRCVQGPALPVCDSFEGDTRLLLLALKLARKLDRRGIPGAMLAIDGIDAA